jgi:hypothetical protein
MHQVNVLAEYRRRRPLNASKRPSVDVVPKSTRRAQAQEVQDGDGMEVRLHEL